MGQKSISLELKKQITPSIFVIGQEYYNESLGNITALFADGNFMTVEGEYKENSLCKTSITVEQKKGEFIEANCDCMFFKNNKKNCCKHIVTLGMMADHSEKISKVIGTDEIEMMFEDDFEEDKNWLKSRKNGKKKRKRLQRVSKGRKLKMMEKINHVRELNFVKKNLMRQVLLNQKELLWRRIILLIMKIWKILI